jgi:cytochrome c oxidase subunit 2
MKAYTLPQTPLPATPFSESLLASGDPKAGRALVTNLAKAPCLTCHNIKGETQYISDDQARGPNLTHVGTRTTIAAGLYPNDAQHLARWIKNAPAMKPGIIMPTFGVGEYDPVTLKGIVKTGFTDQQVADIVAYLQSLK